MKKLLTILLFAPLMAFAAGATLHLDAAPDRSNDIPALQRGAKTFVNYCLNCHSASYMRYNRLHDLGLSDAQIKDNLMFTADKVGELMRTAMQRDEANRVAIVVGNYSEMRRALTKASEKLCGRKTWGDSRRVSPDA